MVILGSKAQKIRIYSRKLPSGNFQVKFYLTTQKGNPYYGYMLVESGKSVRQVMEILFDKLKEIDQPDMYYHKHLFKVGTKSDYDPTFMIFNQSGE
jgi:hypothetical protein